MTTRPKLTPRQRAQVVELLRCCADWAAKGNTVWLDVVAQWLGTDDEAREHARDVGNVVAEMEPFRAERAERARCERSVMPPEWSVRVALEAAARVEAGEWP